MLETSNSVIYQTQTSDANSVSCPTSWLFPWSATTIGSKGNSGWGKSFFIFKHHNCYLHQLLIFLSRFFWWHLSVYTNPSMCLATSITICNLPPSEKVVQWVTSPTEVWKYCHHKSVIVKDPFNAFYSYSLLREKEPTAIKSSFKTQLPLLSTWIICEYWNFCKLNVIQPISLMEKKVRRKRGSHNSSNSKTRNALNFLTL